MSEQFSERRYVFQQDYACTFSNLLSKQLIVAPFWIWSLMSAGLPSWPAARVAARGGGCPKATENQRK